MIRVTSLRLKEDKPGCQDLQFSKGSINVVLGRNRSGKTALCRTLAGLPGPACGDLEIDGRAYEANQAPGSRPVALVYQAFVNYPHWTVEQNIASPLVADGVEDNVRVCELAELLQIGHLLDRLPSELSGGQQQRLAIARALAKSPDLLVMDEPFVNIDYKLREALVAELRLLTDEVGVTLLYATSDPADAMGLADQLFLIGDHEIIQRGEPLHLYQNPLSFDAADLMSDPGVNAYDNGEYVRPEHLRLVRTESAGLCVAGKITGVETNGAETFVHADVSVPIGNQSWVARQRGMLDVLVGQEAWLWADAADVLNLNQAAD